MGNKGKGKGYYHNRHFGPQGRNAEAITRRLKSLYVPTGSPLPQTGEIYCSHPGIRERKPVLEICEDYNPKGEIICSVECAYARHIALEAAKQLLGKELKEKSSLCDRTREVRSEPNCKRVCEMLNVEYIARGCERVCIYAQYMR